MVVLTGAGVSTSSGIPDFRSPGGVWDRFDPQEFTIQRFLADPDRFWQRRARLIAAMDYLDAEPTVAHHALAEAVKDGRVATIITQNVDGLHAKAGTPPDRLIEVHGNGRNTRCLDCHAAEPVETTLERFDHAAPRCIACGGLLKPDVVLFGEPVTRLQEAATRVRGAGTFIAAGTSLVVHPVAGLIEVAASTGADIHICNWEATPYDGLATELHRGPLDEALPRLLQAFLQ